MRLVCGAIGALTWGICLAAVSTALALPAERHYEMVSPVYKGGYGATSIAAVGPEGEAVAYYSPGAFEGAPSGFDRIPYLARRTASGWVTAPLMPPAADTARAEQVDLTPNLAVEFVAAKPGGTSENPLPEEDFLLHSTTLPDTLGNWELAGTLVTVDAKETFSFYESASTDFCHIIVKAEGDSPFTEEAPDAVELYEFNRGCGQAKAGISLVGVNNRGKLINRECDTAIGNSLGYRVGEGASAFAVNAEGSEVFFTVCVTGDEQSVTSPHQLFVRLAGSKTLEVSKPLAAACEFEGIAGEVPCEEAATRAPATFAGASEDGSRVYFTAPLASGQAALVPGDDDSSSNLYMATIGCPSGKPGCGAVEREVTSLTDASHDPVSGQAANVSRVVKIAPDGSRVYFVAGGNLLGKAQLQALESEGRAVPQAGAENLYVYDAVSGGTAFVGDLCSDRERSGSVQDVHCPNEESDHYLLVEAQTAGPDGRYLVFATYAQLTDRDTNRASDVYRYDADTGNLERVSFGENGFDDNGNRTVLAASGNPLGAEIQFHNHGGYVQEEYELNNRAVSEDGSRIVFISAEPLSPMASNGLDNVYEWHEGAGGSEGTVSLISSGGGSERVNGAVISPDGSSIFFETVVGLTAQDTDGAPDIYDARLGEGFPQSPAESTPCEGDACQGPLTNPAPLLVPGSVSQAVGGNFPASEPVAAPRKKAAAKAKKKATTKHKHKQRRRHKPKKKSTDNAKRTAGRSGS
jgi:hypothetical protein